jgi:hypothetical protein
MATAAILNFFNPPKTATYYGMVLRLGNIKMPAVAMETANTLNLTQR